MGKLKIIGGLFAIAAGALILINGIINIVVAADVGSLIVALILSVPILVGGILGLVSKPLAGGIIVSIMTGFYIFLIILPTLIPLPDYYVHVPLSLLYSKLGLYVILTPFELVILPYEGLLIFFGGIFLMASVNEQVQEVKQ
ncbi:MAG: hypothetical protein LUQ65_05585 [Candidatus Helarchaeota archaeon]|nr:hypothetical protein [Candidatus Helarchaeota archaeon]